MATVPVLIRVTLPMTSGLPRDVVVNDFAVQASDSQPTPWTPIIDFYNNTTGPGTFTLASHLSAALSRSANAVRTEAYVIDLATGKLGSPQATDHFTLGPASTTAQTPHEVALCASWASAVPAGVNPQRRKGRVFLGPFVSTDMGGTPSTTLVDGVAAAAAELATALVTNGTPLCVWSRADAALYPVTRGWVDNAWDTQRRRGLRPTGRTAWAL